MIAGSAQQRPERLLAHRARTLSCTSFVRMPITLAFDPLKAESTRHADGLAEYAARIACPQRRGHRSRCSQMRIARATQHAGVLLVRHDEKDVRAAPAPDRTGAGSVARGISSKGVTMEAITASVETRRFRICEVIIFKRHLQASTLVR